MGYSSLHTGSLHTGYGLSVWSFLLRLNWKKTKTYFGYEVAVFSPMEKNKVQNRKGRWLQWNLWCWIGICDINLMNTWFLNIYTDGCYIQKLQVDVYEVAPTSHSANYSLLFTSLCTFISLSKMTPFLIYYFFHIQP